MQNMANYISSLALANFSSERSVLDSESTWDEWTGHKSCEEHRAATILSAEFEVQGAEPDLPSKTYQQDLLSSWLPAFQTLTQSSSILELEVDHDNQIEMLDYKSSLCRLDHSFTMFSEHIDVIRQQRLSQVPTSLLDNSDDLAFVEPDDNGYRSSGLEVGESLTTKDYGRSTSGPDSFLEGMTKLDAIELGNEESVCRSSIQNSNSLLSTNTGSQSCSSTTLSSGLLLAITQPYENNCNDIWLKSCSASSKPESPSTVEVQGSPVHGITKNMIQNREDKSGRGQIFPAANHQYLETTTEKMFDEFEGFVSKYPVQETLAGPVRSQPVPSKTLRKIKLDGEKAGSIQFQSLGEMQDLNCITKAKSPPARSCLTPTKLKIKAHILEDTPPTNAPLLLKPGSSISESSLLLQNTELSTDTECIPPQKRARMDPDLQIRQIESRAAVAAAFWGKMTETQFQTSLDRRLCAGPDSSLELQAAMGPALNTNGKPRARRGSATDPQSVYARHRRERITERLKILQHLIPNGAKVDIVTMLEEAVNYVKFLQLQVKLLSSEEYWMYTPTVYNGLDTSLGIQIP